MSIGSIFDVAWKTGYYGRIFGLSFLLRNLLVSQSSVDKF